MKEIHRYEIYVSGKAPNGQMNTRYIIKDNYTGTETRYEAVVGKGNKFDACMLSLQLALCEINSTGDSAWTVSVKVPSKDILWATMGFSKISAEIKRQREQFLFSEIKVVSEDDMAMIFSDSKEGEK